MPTVAAQFAAAISEGASIEDVSAGGLVYVDSVTENMSAADASAVLSNFLFSLAENLNSVDAPTVTAAFSVAISENAVLAERFGVGGWIKIISTQTPNWQNLNTE